jgi:type IV pilus assembly protein PilN
MIKINLLPTKRKPPRKVTELQKDFIGAVLVFGGIAAVLAFHLISLNNTIEAKTKDRAAALAEVARQDNMLREVKNVEDERKKVTDKIGIIEQLKKNQQGPVRLLDEISRAIPATADILSMTETGGNINLTGEAFSNEDVVKFVENLKASEFFTDVYLSETSQKSIKEGYELYEYKLQFKYKGL